MRIGFGVTNQIKRGGDGKWRWYIYNGGQFQAMSKPFKTWLQAKANLDDIRRSAPDWEMQGLEANQDA